MTTAIKTPPGGIPAGLDYRRIDNSNEIVIAQKAARVSRAIALLQKEFIAEALRIVAIKASHAADDLELGDDICAARNLGIVVANVREAAKAFRELEQLTAEGAQ